MGSDEIRKSKLMILRTESNQTNMTVVITVIVFTTIFLLNYPCVFTNTEVSHSSHFNYIFVLLSHFLLVWISCLLDL